MKLVCEGKVDEACAIFGKEKQFGGLPAVDAPYGREPAFEIMAKTFEAAADMVAAMPAAVDHKEQIDRAYKQGYLDGSVFALKKWGGIDE